MGLTNHAITIEFSASQEEKEAEVDGWSGSRPCQITEFSLAFNHQKAPSGTIDGSWSHSIGVE